MRKAATLSIRQPASHMRTWAPSCDICPPNAIELNPSQRPFVNSEALRG